MKILELTKENHKLFDNDKCVRCGERFILNRYMVYIRMGCFHLTCFKKYSENKINEYNEKIKEIRMNIEQLKPHEKEMICETLLKEKYG